MKHQYIVISLITILLCGCSQRENIRSCFPIISWGGISADKADTLFTLAKDCGFNMHLGLYRTKENALKSLDAAERSEIGMIVSFPQIKDSTVSAVESVRNHPALYAYHLKDEPDTADFDWLKELSTGINHLDPEHPCYINLLPNWAWGEDNYSERIEEFADNIDIPFYSFDHYPIIEEDGKSVVRSCWYRNLEEISAMSRRHRKPFWGFALAKSHSITDPWPDTSYPEPTLGHIRLQVFSNLLYGAQAIQYFNFTGIVDPATCKKLPAYELVRKVNSEIKAYSHIFAGSKVLGVWHTGEIIPSGTKRLEVMPHEKVKSLSIRGEGAVVSLIENHGKTYLAVQNKDHIKPAILDISFSSRVLRILPYKKEHNNPGPITIEPGNVMIFRL